MPDPEWFRLSHSKKVGLWFRPRAIKVSKPGTEGKEIVWAYEALLLVRR